MKFSVIVCENQEKWGGSHGVGKMTTSLLKTNQDDDWSYFRAIDGELPPVEDLKKYKGSIASANDDEPWINSLKKFIQRVYQLQQTEPKLAPKIFGSCFGHQVICSALGGKVGKNGSGKFLLTRENLKIHEELMSKEFYKRIYGENDVIEILQSHGEEILELPSNGKQVGSSQSCRNEVVMFGPGVLTIQGHMDFTEEQALEKILPALVAKGKLNDADAAETKKLFTEKQIDAQKIVRLINSFFESD